MPLSNGINLFQISTIFEINLVKTNVKKEE